LPVRFASRRFDAIRYVSELLEPGIRATLARMEKRERLVLIGTGAFAQVAYEYFTHDSPYEVVAFAVEREFIEGPELFGVPIVPFDEMAAHFAPKDHHFFVAITYFGLNKVRARLYQTARDAGYRAASYVSPHAFVWRNAQLGEHCFVFEQAVIQPFVKIGDDVIFWSGCFIGHHSRIGDHCFVAAHSAVNGTASVGAYSFLGANSTIANHVSVAENCIISAGSHVMSDVERDQVILGTWRKKTLTSTSRLNSEFFLE
jgi:sugar O-acyltransferase (sialic acid O-acetyltransferase NeuD family)